MRLLEDDEFVMYGDIIMADIPNLDCGIAGATVGVIDKDGLSMFVGEKGIIKHQLREANSIWRV